MTGIRLTTYVHGRLRRWAAWRRAANDVGPKRLLSWWYPVVMRGKMQRGPRDWDKVEYEDNECFETEMAVQALGEHDEQLRDVVWQHYVVRGSAEQQAKALHCSVKTVYNRLDRAEQFMLGLLNDAAAGLRPYV